MKRLAAATLLLAGPALADEGWQIDGSSLTRLEQYTINGVRAASPYQNAGLQFNTDLDLTASRDLSAFESVSARMAGTFNESEYRGAEQGLLAENLSLAWQKGDGAVPLRLQGGDFYAYQSNLTVQRALKGGLFEIQPDLGGGADHSLQLFAGFSAPVWRDMDPGNEHMEGASWLTEHPSLGALALNWVHAAREADIAAGLGDRSQQTMSIAGSHDLPLWGRDLALDWESAWFHGELPAQPAGPADTKSDSAWYLSLSDDGAGPGFFWSALYERTGANFQPFGGAASFDQRNREARAGWRLDGLTAEARRLDLRTGFDSGNPTDSDTWGASLSGSLPLGGENASLRLDGQTTSSADRAGTVDGHVRQLSARLNRPLGEGWSGQIGTQFRRAENGAAGGDARLRVLDAGLSGPVEWAGWTGHLSPGLALRESQGSGARQMEWAPSLSLDMARDGQQIRLSHSSQLLDAAGAGAIDSATHRSAAAWSWSQGPHRVEISGDHFQLDPALGAGTSAWRLGASYQLRLGADLWDGAASPAAALAPPPAGDGKPQLAALAPGQSASQALGHLAEAGLGGGAPVAGLQVFEGRLLENVTEDQQVALETGDGLVRRSAVLLALSDAPIRAALQWRDTLEAALRLLGPPDVTSDLGEFSPNLSADIATGAFRRLAEWRRPGYRIRLGIPDAPAGPLRIQLVQAPSFGPVTDPRWGFDIP